MRELTIDKMLVAAQEAFYAAWVGEVDDYAPVWALAQILSSTVDFVQSTGDGVARDFIKVAASAQCLLGKEAHRVDAERLAQEAQWGGLEHDVTHTPDEWWAFIQKQLDRLPARPKNANFDKAPAEEDEERRVIIAKVGALALSAAYALREREQRELRTAE